MLTWHWGAGRYPLDCRVEGRASPLEMYELLLHYGADNTLENVHGDTVVSLVFTALFLPEELRDSLLEVQNVSLF